MNLKQKILLSLSILIGVLTLDYLFLHIVFPIKKQRIMKEANKEVELSLEMFPVSQPDQHKILENGDFHTAAQACTGLKWQSFETFPQELEKAYGIQSRHQIPVETTESSTSRISKERWLLGNGTTLFMTIKNNQIEELQLLGANKTLSCVKESCQCR